MLGSITRTKEGNGTKYPLARMRQEFDSLFDRFFGSLPFEFHMGHERYWEVDVQETEKEFVVRAEVPGFESDDFDLAVRGNELCIKAERTEETGKKTAGHEYACKGACHYERRIALPAGVDTDKVKARYHSGVLEIFLAKTEEAKAKKIAVGK